MSCFNPLIAVRDGYTCNGKPNYKILGNISHYYDVDVGHIEGEQDSILVPCGKCKGCRLDKSKHWADRMLLEFDRTKKAVFITLTYNDENLNDFDVCDYFDECDDDYIEYKGNSLCKEDFQLYMKRLRENIENISLRMYSCGEYGKKYNRSHYHEILFGVDLDDIKKFYPDLRFYKYNKLKQPMYISPSFSEGVWKNGFVVFAEATWNDMAYTARYVTKKCDGLAAAEKYKDGRIPEFSLMSRNPGIGMYYLYDHPEIFDTGKTFINIKGEPKEIYIPLEFYRYIEDICNKLKDPDRYFKTKDGYNRCKRLYRPWFDDIIKPQYDSLPRMYVESKNTDLTVPEYYKMRFEKFDKATDRLEESLIYI